MTGRQDSATVLIVEDEPGLREMYASALSDRYEIETARDGQTALEALDETVDVVLLDLKMPRLTGDHVLEHIRAEGYDCKVAMLTAVEPDVDLVEMPCDDYVVKPVGLTALRDTVESLLTLRDHEESVREHVTDSLKLAALEAAGGDSGDETIEELRRRVEEQSVKIGDLSSELSPEEYQQVLRVLVRSLDNGP